MDKALLTIKKFFGKKYYKIIPGDKFSVHMENNEVLSLECTKCIHSKTSDKEEDRFDLIEAVDPKTKKMYVFCIDYYLYPNEEEDYKKSNFKIVDADGEDIF